MTSGKLLNSEILQFLMQYNELMKTLPRDIPLAEARMMYENFAMNHAGVPLKMARIDDLNILNQEKNYWIPVRIYRPKPDTMLPGLLYFHGGGWQKGSLNTHDSICRNLALRGCCTVISVQWRLAPEHRFPAGLKDCHDVYHWLLHHAPLYNIDAQRIAIGGDSAGGNLAAALALCLKEQGTPQPVCQLLLYPSLDLTCGASSYQTYGEDYFLTTEKIHDYIKYYINQASDIENPLVSPLKANDLSGLASAVIITAGFDPLRDEGEAYAGKLRQCHVPVIHKCYESMIHAFLHMTETVSEVRIIFNDIAKMLQQGFDRNIG
ncbi:alpha/beta hydrolase [Legionella spiritensis]|uniref:alpha/beta hydrolase n=1 Tax=Legionella spiritensis TaxID=452 RepID=UPI000F6E37B0|nr:alpha/beta hydrolase [Legionella spiritensis]VEG92455.1 alpha/beta hydrolase [Legionella spiritensis]